VAKGIIEVSDDTFDEQVGLADGPVLVDFWAEWCGPCRQITPVLEEIAQEKAGSLTIVKINVDDNPKLSQRFQVMTIPTLILFNNGEARARMSGAKSKRALLADLEPHLAKAGKPGEGRVAV
jgi:thioredoxin 1